MIIFPNSNYYSTRKVLYRFQSFLNGSEISVHLHHVSICDGHTPDRTYLARIACQKQVSLEQLEQEVVIKREQQKPCSSFVHWLEKPSPEGREKYIIFVTSEKFRMRPVSGYSVIIYFCTVFILSCNHLL